MSSEKQCDHEWELAVDDTKVAHCHKCGEIDCGDVLASLARKLTIIGTKYLMKTRPKGCVQFADILMLDAHFIREHIDDPEYEKDCSAAIFSIIYQLSGLLVDGMNKGFINEETIEQQLKSFTERSN